MSSAGCCDDSRAPFIICYVYFGCLIVGPVELSAFLQLNLSKVVEVCLGGDDSLEHAELLESVCNAAARSRNIISKLTDRWTQVELESARLA